MGVVKKMLNKRGRYCQFKGMQKVNEMSVEGERTLLTLLQSGAVISEPSLDQVNQHHNFNTSHQDVPAVTHPLMSSTLTSTGLVSLGCWCDMLRWGVSFDGFLLPYSGIGKPNMLHLMFLSLWCWTHTAYFAHMRWIRFISEVADLYAVTWIRFNCYYSSLGWALKTSLRPILFKWRPYRMPLWESWLVDWVQWCYSLQMNAACIH